MIYFYAHHNDNPVSWLIRVFSPKYNHISIRVNTFVYEAHAGKGVTKTQIKKWKGAKSVIAERRFDTSKSCEARVKRFLEKQVGKRYDMAGVFSFVWRFTQPKIGYWFCSELAMASLYKMLGIGSNVDGYNQKVSPSQFWKILNRMEIADML